MNQIKCPYCRKIHNNLLPFDVDNKIRGVNCPEKYCMSFLKCNYIFKSGKNKGLQCDKDVITINKKYCKKHFKDETIIVDNKLLSEYTVVKLKEILREKKLKISGNKAELIKRLQDNSYL